MKLGWIISSFPYFIHAYMEEAVFRYWKGSLSCEQCYFLLKVARETGHASMWRLIKGNVDGKCG